MNTILKKLYDTCVAAGLNPSLREGSRLILIDWSDENYSFLGVLEDLRIFHVNIKTGTEMFNDIEETMENIAG